MSALTDTFTAIANKIRAKLGVQTTYTPAEMPDGIDAVYSKGVSDTKVGTAAAGDVLSGKTFTNSSSVGANGSMTNKGSTGFTITNTSAVTIPAGYYNGSGKIQTSGMMVTPTATKSITADGSNIDVLNYAKANVSVPINSYYLPGIESIDDYSTQNVSYIWFHMGNGERDPYAKCALLIIMLPTNSYDISSVTLQNSTGSTLVQMWTPSTASGSSSYTPTKNGTYIKYRSWGYLVKRGTNTGHYFSVKITYSNSGGDHENGQIFVINLA